LRARRPDEQSRTAPTGNTLGSCVDNMIADQMDNLPEAVMLPEREETARSAEEMDDVVSFVLYRAGWTGKYQTLMEDAIVTGTGVAQVFWDEDMEDGEGMVNVLAWHPEDFYPDPMYEDMQDGRGCFKATRTSVAWVEQHYPQAKGYVTGDEYAKEEADDRQAPEGDTRVTLLEFWYKQYDAQAKKTRVHMAQVAGRALLFSTETGYGAESEYPEGLYAHGEYPFVLYKYRDAWRKPFGTGLIHDYYDTQTAIDRYAKYIDDNARESSVQRHFIEGERRESRRRGRHAQDDHRVGRQRHPRVMQTVQAAPINGQVYEMMRYMADTMKQDCGQNQFTRGEGGLNVTAGTAIHYLQEAGGKITRWHSERFKDAFRRMIEQILWVLSEYMEPGRKLRIIGGWNSAGGMRERIIELVAPDRRGGALPRPAYTVRVQVQRGNPNQIQSDNEFLMQAVKICATRIAAAAGDGDPADGGISGKEGAESDSGEWFAVSGMRGGTLLPSAGEELLPPPAGGPLPRGGGLWGGLRGMSEYLREGRRVIGGAMRRNLPPPAAVLSSRREVFGERCGDGGTVKFL
ncbi:MAG: hypothetical protein ACLUI3_12075, partial [Christensenellales bacterium]